MLRFSVPLAVPAAFTFVSTAAAQAVQVRITAPANGAVLPGPDVTVNIAVTGATLVPGAEATRLEDLHVHYILDTDVAPYVNASMAIPMGNPNIVHTAAMSQTFAGLAPGLHRVYVILGLSNHVAVQPPVAPFVTFTIGAAGGAAQAPGAAQVPGALPRTGDAADFAVGWLALAGGFGIAIGTALRRRRSAGT